MPKVSVLVPAFRPQYLDTCLASIFSQTLDDYEVLVGDDSDGSDVASVVSKWEDPRLRYERNPRRQEPGANRDFLRDRAQGRYTKFLFDDDFLLPRSLEFLTAAADQLDAKLVFHARHIVDDAGRVLRSESPVPAGQVLDVPSPFVFEHMVAGVLNFIGEPSNILIDTETLRSLQNPFGIEDQRLRFLTDVALYVNFAHLNLRTVGIGAPLSAFRSHGGQNSAMGSPIFSAGLFEWELLQRWAADNEHLSADAARAAIELSHSSYLPHMVRLPELSAFIALGTDPDVQGRFLSPRFRAAAETAYAAVDDRVRSRVAA